MWDLVRATDWSQTCLGPYETWSVSLKSTLRMVLASRQTICFWWGRDLLQFHNEAYLPILGQRAEGAFGKPFRELWADVWDDVEPFTRSALSGVGTWTEDLPLTMTRNGDPEQTYWSFSYSPLYDDAGEIAGILNITTETTKAVMARQTQATANVNLSDALDAANITIGHQAEDQRMRRVVQRELAHRLKNSFAMVQAIVSQSIRGQTSAAVAGEAIIARIGALSSAQDMLVQAGSGGVSVTEIIETALRPHIDGTSGQVTLSGPLVRLSAQQGMGLALAIHELATNATKYGGLSVAGGTVAVTWTVDDAAFGFVWHEQGGPVVVAPAAKGFGSRLLERIVPGYFSGKATVSYASEGVAYSLVGTLADADD